MGWDRRVPEGVEAPKPPVMMRWLLAAIVAVLVGVLLFVLHASERLPWLQVLNIWALAGFPLLVWVLAFGARAHLYGGALSHYQFLEAQAREAEQSWQGWAQRSLAVAASCVLLPDQVSASVLVQNPSAIPLRTDTVRRLAALPAREARAAAGLQMLIQALAPSLQTLPVGQDLRITLLSDVAPDHYQALRDDVQKTWSAGPNLSQPVMISVVNELSFQWVDDVFKTVSTTIELVLVLQVCGKDTYSDGLAALLLCPDALAQALKLPVTAGLLRPMPLSIDALDSEFSLFLQTQTSAGKATGLLADGADWQPITGRILAIAAEHGSSLQAEQQWLLEGLCGRPGPLGHWLVTALGVEIVRHQRQPLLVLAREKSQRWISTVTTGELA
ncbi:hypothetical protein [Pseudomonas sp. AM4(2022)]|uniref:hypothetical protein n=1 Tax=Pseudomonas sp. AM4(2022) TaxID=2983408 RepID=UPI002E80CA8D|nr:hypothetical protein [Pseudomonas sp. AM4(2022)]